MTAEPNYVKSIFLAAVEKSPAERAAFLSEVVGDDVAFRARVEALLRAHDNPDSFLAEPVAEFGATVDLSPAEPPLAERPGTLIGPYKLLEQIGEGGMGVVYMADQQTPVRRRVALKIIKAGMDTRQVIARFEAERQALALMDHSNIARVLDAGATESGRPYFVMELVRGTPITEYCDQNNLPVHERLELFVQVCHAVQHAHQKGIIHRDLKPSNVLVTLHDGRPVPKVIDFGVAKATNQQLTEKTLFTAFTQMVGTPLYMSPEQAEMTSLDIDTRSDIYSLGVLLYELLTGTTPFDQERLRSAAFDEIRRIIREEEPPKPSTRLSSTEALPSIAANRSLEPKKLSGLIRGELDWIVMRCLEKDRSRRYDTASTLAIDVQRYLNDEPVDACPPTRTYRLRKFVRRNKAGVLAGSAIVAALSAGLAASSYFAASASREARISEGALEQAEVNRTHAEGVNRFFTEEVFGLADPNRFNRAGITLVEALDVAANKIDSRFPDDPELRAVIRERFGAIYNTIDKPLLAVVQLREAVKLRRDLVGEMDAATMNARSDLGLALYKVGRWNDSRTELESVLSDQSGVLGAGHPDAVQTAAELALVLMEIRGGWWNWAAQPPQGDGDIDVPRNAYRAALATLGPHHPSTLIIESALARSLRWRKKSDEAIGYAKEAAIGLRETKGEENSEALWATYEYAACLADLGHSEKAIPEFKRLLEIRNRVLGRNHYDTLCTAWGLANVLRLAGLPSDSIAVLEDVHAHIDEIQTLRTWQRGNKLVDFANTYVDLHRSDRAADFLAVAFASVDPPPDDETQQNKYAKFLSKLADGCLRIPEPELRKTNWAIQLSTKACALTDYKSADFINTLVRANVEGGDYPAAAKAQAKLLQLRPDDPQEHVAAAMLNIRAHDVDGYRVACAAMWRQFAESTDDQVRFLVASACGFGRAALDDLSGPVKLAHNLVETNPGQQEFLTTLGILQYRAADYQQAEKYLSDTIAAYDKNGSPQSDALGARLFLAMTRSQLGAHDEARRLLVDAQTAMDEIAKTATWDRRATLELFRREAEALIQPVESTAPPSATDPATQP